MIDVDVPVIVDLAELVDPLCCTIGRQRRRCVVKNVRTTEDFMDKNQEHNHAVAESSDSDLARLRAMLGTAENLEPTHLRVEQYALDGKHFLRMEIAAPPWQPAGHDLARRPMPKVVSFVVFVFDAAGRLLQFEADAFPR